MKKMPVDNSKSLKLFRPLDVVLYALVIFCALIFIFFLPRDKGEVVQVFSNGKMVAEFSLAEDRLYKFDTILGEMTIEIADGKVRAKQAECADKVCVASGEIELAGQTIICLPAKIVIKIIGEDAFDGVV